MEERALCQVGDTVAFGAERASKKVSMVRVAPCLAGCAPSLAVAMTRVQGEEEGKEGCRGGGARAVKAFK